TAHQSSATLHSATTMVLPLKHCPPQSSRPISDKSRSSHPRPARTPPSTFLFLHLHLSNSPHLLVRELHRRELISATSLVSFAVEVSVAGALHIADFERPSRAFLKKNSGASRKKKHQRKQRWSRKS